MGRKNVFVYLTIGWLLVILGLSLLTFSCLPKGSLENSDKYAHFFLYFVLTFFLYKAVKSRFKSNIVRVVWVFICVFLFGMIVELLQAILTVTRTAEWMDAVANGLGSLSALILLLVFDQKVKY